MMSIKRMSVTTTGAATRTQILDVAERLISERGYHGTSLRDIGKEVGIANASLLYHFPSKDHLHDAVMARMAEGLEAAIAGIEAKEGDGDKRARAVAEGLNAWMSADPRRARLLLRQLLDGDGTAKAKRNTAIGQAVDRLAGFLEGGAKGGPMRKVDSGHLLIRILGAGLLYSLYGPAGGADDFSKQESRLLSRSLGKSKNKNK